IYSTSSDKYKNLTKWLVANYSIVNSSLRDNFTAGGQLTIELEDSTFPDMPRVFKSFHDSLTLFSKHIAEISLEELQEFWNGYTPQEDTLVARLSFWQNQIEHN